MRFFINFQFFSTIFGQAVLALSSLIIFAVLFHKPITTFNPVGSESFILPITPKTIAIWGKEPIKVKTGFMIHEFLKFNPVKNEFLINAILWFEFDQSKISLEKVGKFFFTKGEIVQKSEPLLKELPNNITRVEYQLRIHFNTLWDYSLFPLDDHKMFLNLTSAAVQAHEMIYVVEPSDFTVADYIYISGWKILSHKARSGYTEYILSSEKDGIQHPKVLFEIDLKKQDIRQLILMLLPVLMLFYFCMFTLAIVDFSLDMQLMFTLATAFMAYNIVIQNMSPDVGYFMMIDYLVLLFMIALGIIFSASILQQLPKTTLSAAGMQRIKGFATLLIYIMLITAIFYLTHLYKIGA